MNKFGTILLLVAMLLVVCVVPAVAQEAGAAAKAPVATDAGDAGVLQFSRYFGAAAITIGAAYGIGKLASSALESMARQPEVAGSIQTAMIIAAALIEGFTFFALVICFVK